MNNLNEDIKILERMLKIEKECLHYDVSQDEIRAIEHLIKAYKELEEKNSKLKNKLLDTMKGSKIIREETPQYIKENYIPVSLVEETIEELNEYYKKEIYPSLMNWSDVDITECYDVMIGILQELLEKRK